MITGIPLEQHRPDWQKQMAQAISDPRTLLVRLGLDPETIEFIPEPDQFPMRVPEAFFKRMRPNDPEDPLLRQVLPLAREHIATAGYSTDPVGDLNASTGKGLLHKYHGRALLVTTQACAVHCRYCFRRHFPYSDHRITQDEWTSAIDYLREHEEISEIILSGGDPLSLSDQRLKGLIDQLDQIPHLQRLRIHTRQPVVIPDRITDALLDILKDSRLIPVIVLHINHPNEIDDHLAERISALRGTGITLLNQAVLLRAINDDLSTLVLLSEKLFEIGVLPYYLHLLDRVSGAAHFEVEEEQASTLYHRLQCKLPGYLTPRLVREQAGHAYKTPVRIRESE